MRNRTTNGGNMRDEMIGSVATAAAKAAPPATVTAAIAAGKSLDNIVVILTIIYLAAQIIYLGWRWFREWRQKGGTDER